MVFEKTKLIHEDLTYKIIGCAFEVHKELGPGFLESAYEAAMLIELKNQGLGAISQKRFPLFYKGVRIKDYSCDLAVDEKVILELKALKRIGDIERAQTLNYLKVTGLKVGLILNFGEKSLKHERLVL
ncbi:MAG: GxxExxY protein [Candidatus Marinimicrobia bacterium]|jgi:GxxExxY protein|nr:GxxExxY protein [Candidatus Neomarinimicrobiota bacterium]MBT3631310.1 GxxExxY protein [Candidatus Neomarinimicrobiota bacterium]MBT3825782.1 GxxExxY protein [Candidatus Neomarinimicrobiota bacterium]MBT4130834.1 GxxExxY protein [Candidatus Neomarinimicrobiota bacterium]MBT4295715.1 GxxExxY protein [Candidatus Neomarinimicrobiota bacterium]